MALHTSTEIERKYDVDDAVELPALDGVAPTRVEETVTLRAVYFDTTDNALAAHSTVLRRRSGGTDEGWHVKQPTDGGRTETHAPLGGASSAQTPPDEIVEVVRALLDGKPLQETARLTTERSTITVLDSDGTALAAVTDDLVSATDVRTGILRVWREWEVELSGDLTARPEEGTALLDRIEKLLLAAGAEHSRSASKFARATGRSALAATDADSAPDVDAAPEVDAATDVDAARDEGAAHDADAAGTLSALEVANTILGELTDQLVAAEPRVRADEDDAVHSMRILVRRLRGVLAAFRGVWPAGDVVTLRGQLRQLGDVLGAARDAEVRGMRAALLLNQDAPAMANVRPGDEREDTAAGDHAAGNHEAGDHGGGSQEARRRLVEDAHGEYEVRLTELTQYLDSADYARVLAAVRDLVDRPARAELADRPARATLRRALRRQQRRSRRRLARADRTDLDSLHGARKAARRLRYVAEALTEGDTPLLGGNVRSLASAAEQVQDVLGSHRDATLFLERLTEASTQALEAGENTAVYAALETAERRRTREALEQVDDAEQNLSRAAKL